MIGTVTPQRAKALRVAAIVGAVHLMPAEALFRITRGGDAESTARHEFCWLLHTACDLSLNEVAAVIGRDRSSVSYAVRKTEDALEDEGRAHRLERLAELVRELCIIGALQDEFMAQAVELEQT